MKVKVTRCHYEELEKALNEIGYENVVEIYPIAYFSGAIELGTDIGYTIIYKDGETE